MRGQFRPEKRGLIDRIFHPGKCTPSNGFGPVFFSPANVLSTSLQKQRKTKLILIISPPNAKKKPHTAVTQWAENSIMTPVYSAGQTKHPPLTSTLSKAPASSC
ncbi:MAG TPA: hypothetical protein DCF33_18420 [Saprospirales bacterium]|nr:hypothetical protein [Saprospirales bacterium]